MRDFLEGLSVAIAVSVLIFDVLIIATTVYSHFEWRRNRNKDFPVRSDESDDFMVASNSIINVIQERLEMSGPISKQDSEILCNLKDSSDLFSLVRCAHYAGFHITFEQATAEGEVDPDDGDPNIFKTDLKKAAKSIEDKKWAQYRRY